jgi:hypothetical protein
MTVETGMLSLQPEQDFQVGKAQLYSAKHTRVEESPQLLVGRCNLQIRPADE